MAAEAQVELTPDDDWHAATSPPPMSTVTNATWCGWARRKATASPSWVPVVYEQPGPLAIEMVVAPPHPRSTACRLE